MLWMPFSGQGSPKNMQNIHVDEVNKMTSTFCTNFLHLILKSHSSSPLCPDSLFAFKYFRLSHFEKANLRPALNLLVWLPLQPTLSLLPTQCVSDWLCCMLGIQMSSATVLFQRQDCKTYTSMFISLNP